MFKVPEFLLFVKKFIRMSKQTKIKMNLKEKNEKKSRRVAYYILCSLRTVIGDVLVSAMPGVALKTSPTK